MHIRHPSFSSFNSRLTPHTAHLTHQTSQHTTHTSHLTPHTSCLEPCASNQPGNSSNQPGKNNSSQPAQNSSQRFQPRIQIPGKCHIALNHMTKHASMGSATAPTEPDQQPMMNLRTWIRRNLLYWQPPLQESARKWL